MSEESIEWSQKWLMASIIVSAYSLFFWVLLYMPEQISDTVKPYDAVANIEHYTDYSNPFVYAFFEGGLLPQFLFLVIIGGTIIWLYRARKDNWEFIYDG